MSGKKIFIFWYVFPFFLLFLFICYRIIQENNVQNIVHTFKNPTPGLQRVRVSIPYWDQERASQSFRENAFLIDDVSFFWYHLTSDSSIDQYDLADIDSELIDFSKEHNITTTILIANLGDNDGSGWSSGRVENAIENEDSRGEHIHEIVDLVTEVGADGVSIDYEELDQGLKNEYSTFLKELSRALHTQNKRLGVALHPKDSDDEGGLGAFQDWKKIGEYADEVYIMTYNEHWDASVAGPVASYDWVNAILEYAVSKIDPQKIFLGVPLYGYDWNKDDNSQATGLTYQEIDEIARENDTSIEWDDTAKSPYLFYIDGDHEQHEVWFENARSVGVKKELAKKYNVRGVTLWRLGGEDQGIWKTQ